MVNISSKEQIDFVITWVDGSDPEWLAQRAEYSPVSSDNREQRYRDWGFLKYWFRGVERFAPWVSKVHLVTYGHYPDWLNTENPKLRIVKHSDFMPEKYLPTFNSNPLELNFFRINDLTEKFVYFNDDILLLNSVSPEDFFAEGKPVDMLALQPVVANPENPVMSHILLNDSLVICKYFDKRTQMKKLKGKFFKIGYPFMYYAYNLLEKAFPLYTGFYTVHGPSPLLKSSYKELWDKEGDLFDEVSSHKFRENGDITQYIFREWEKQKGNFIPVNLHKKFQYLDIGDNTEKLCDFIEKQKKKTVCLNDTNGRIDFEKTKTAVLASLDKILPKKSTFELYQKNKKQTDKVCFLHKLKNERRFLLYKHSLDKRKKLFYRISDFSAVGLYALV